MSAKIMLIDVPGSVKEPVKVFIYEGPHVIEHSLSGLSMIELAHTIAYDIASVDKVAMTLVDAPHGVGALLEQYLEGRVPNVRLVPSMHTRDGSMWRRG